MPQLFFVICDAKVISTALDFTGIISEIFLLEQQKVATWKATTRFVF